MKKSSKGFTLVELLVVIGILGILMSVLFPQVSSAIFTANLSACSMKGRKLFQAITQSEISRLQVGRGTVWPQNGSSGSEGGDTSDIAAQSFNNSADYFTKLFDLENASSGEGKHMPYVDKETALDLLWGFGVNPARTGTTKFQGDNILWTIAANMPDGAPDFIPVLVSRNVPADKLLNKMASAQSTRIGIGSKNGAKFDTPFGSKGCVIITRGGAAKTIDNPNNATYDVLYNQVFDISESSEDRGAFCYLGPNTKETPTSN